MQDTYACLNSIDIPWRRVCWFSGKDIFPSTILLRMLDISYSFRTLANWSAREKDSPKRAKRPVLNVLAVWLMSVREAIEIGIDAGYWTALRVNTI
jgi:hypothetical protein